MSDVLLRASAWLSLASWAAGEWLLASSATPHRERRARGAFTLGALALLLHTGLALHVRHAWSQTDALLAIARETAEVTGLAFGGGLFVNYAFLAFWLAEAVAWWRSPTRYLNRPARVRWVSRAVFLFMFVNGAVVFGHGPVRVFGTLAILAVCWSWYRGRWGQDEVIAEPGARRVGSSEASR
jgi:hypothetical protein